ncbi:Steroid receptor seven-up, A like [Quillaja saponaria]|uniref:Steroid receptor seven-up, A like n=1 Tax=Quillaja saponaria TaxID=32244 RepID=A0AAD7L7Q5_QUISA|nr:Steroid receptor seven-up, A like [Quillaja saponaria]
MKSNLCIPRFKSNARTNNIKNKSNLSPMSMLERFREAVLRLIMVSALSKATNQAATGSDGGQFYYPNDPHHSEAVADCIEFIKKKALSDTEENRQSTACNNSMDTTAELVIRMPVM